MTSPLQQKIKITGPVVVTANRASDGAVVYRRLDGGWTTELAAAAITSEVAVAREMVQGALADGLRTIDPYIAPVRVNRDGDVQPGNLRERIRRNGPTIELPLSARGRTGVKVDAHVHL